MTVHGRHSRKLYAVSDRHEHVFGVCRSTLSPCRVSDGVSACTPVGHSQLRHERISHLRLVARVRVKMTRDGPGPDFSRRPDISRGKDNEPRILRPQLFSRRPLKDPGFWILDSESCLVLQALVL